ncbi:MAG: GNAT family N-acetyltransferase [Clostridium sp.]
MLKNNLELRKLSILSANNIKLEFVKEVEKLYIFTSHLEKDYPEYFKWFFTKMIPGIFKCEREIINLYIDNTLAGTIFLKNSDEEKKICTFYMSEDARKKGVATLLLERAFEFLGTTKPLITIADYKIEQFEKIIKKYNWQKTQTIKGKYNSHSKEIVFNGTLI